DPDDHDREHAEPARGLHLLAALLRRRDGGAPRLAVDALAVSLVGGLRHGGAVYRRPRRVFGRPVYVGRPPGGHWYRGAPWPCSCRNTVAPRSPTPTASAPWPSTSSGRAAVATRSWSSYRRWARPPTTSSGWPTSWPPARRHARWTCCSRRASASPSRCCAWPSST